ncbi:hypothetical protein M2352_004992 [Azospirillum fermentarium]|uniref:cellulose biosynthesis protein BcsN n=1 Tax=Azospirillum fermentarium TaxID=1233114 RepID=UPI0022279E6E|nr:cellulose biosynthesis protein BcsN [Azospirillum fermentarium]MCW2249332.1 hypothetical protein [Azospirillum fermentarium]
MTCVQEAPRRRARVGGMLVWAGLVAGLAGCGGYMPRYTGNLPTPWQRVAAPDLPVVLPAGAPVSVVAARSRAVGPVYRSYAVVLSNASVLPGENRLSLDVQAVPDNLFDALVPPERPFPVPLYTSETLAETLEKEFPGMDVKVADGARRNRYGDYDYAVASGVDDAGAGSVCVLAWQLVTDHGRILPQRVEAVRLEWRVCAPGADPRPLLQPFDRLGLRLGETVLDAEAATLATPDRRW